MSQATCVVALVACLLCLDACAADEQATREGRPSGSAGLPAAPPVGSPERLAALRVELEDAQNRLVPSFDDRVGAAILRIHLGELWARVAASDPDGARRALESARRALGEVEGAAGPDSVAGSAIRLVLDHAGVVLDSAHYR